MNQFFALIIVLLLPLNALGADEIRFRHNRSLYADDKGVGMKQPEGVACNKDRLAAADTGNGRIILYSLIAGEFRGGTEIKLPQVIYPTRVAMSSKGDLYVLDARQRKVARLTAEGAFQQYVDLSSGPTAGMVVPVGISLDGSDNLYVLDIGGGSVMVFGNDGKFQRQAVFPKRYGFISDLTVDRRGTVFLVDSVNSEVYSTATATAAFLPINEKMKDSMNFASNITADDKGLLYISDQNSGKIIVVSQDGTIQRLFNLGWNEGTLRYPAQMCIGPDGDLFVADRANSRIQMFTPLK
jgi:sugar lactone lactonase YvrE